MIKLALFQPQIPQNTGNIARLCVGLDIPLIIAGKTGFSLSDKYLKRAGLDYWEHLKLEIFTTYEEFLEKYGKNRILYATTKGKNPYYKIDYLMDDIIMFGSETSGLPDNILKENIENTITIPMPGKVRSLNLSNSAAVVAYHALQGVGYFDEFVVNRNYHTLFLKAL